MSALYRFEASDLLGDSSGNERHLTAVSSPSASTDAMQGDGSAVVGGEEEASFVSNDSFFAFDDSFVVGGWFLATFDGSSPNIVRRQSLDDAGYLIERLGLERAAACQMGNPGGANSNPGLMTTDGTWNLDEWVHVVCVFDRAALRLEAAMDGVVDVASNVPTWSSSSEPLRIAENFTGQIDELFFWSGTMDAASIARIFACGVDGERCRCTAAEPRLYESCGRAENCATLAPCDQAAPTP